MSSPSSSTVTLNNTCYTGSATDTFTAFGDGATMGFSAMGMVINCICCSIFLYWATSTKQAFPIILTVCCILSLCTSAWKYYSAQADIDSMKTSGKLKTC